MSDRWRGLWFVLISCTFLLGGGVGVVWLGLGEEEERVSI